MNHLAGSPFDSVESAHEFVALLTQAVAEAKQDVEADVKRESNSHFPRRLDALRLTLYNLEKLELHMSRSRRILNDLRSLRRLLFEERTAKPATVQTKTIQKAQPVALEPVLPSRPSPASARPTSAAAA